MGAAKSFDAARKELKGETLDFVVGGQEFAIQLPIPGYAILDMAALEDADGAAAVATFGQFMSNIMSDEDAHRFRKATIDARYSFEEILEVVKWVIEEATGRPTEQLSDSPGLQSSNTTASLAAAS